MGLSTGMSADLGERQALRAALSPVFPGFGGRPWLAGELPYLMVMTNSSLKQRTSGMYMPWPAFGSAWKSPGISARSR